MKFSDWQMKLAKEIKAGQYGFSKVGGTLFIEPGGADFLQLVAAWRLDENGRRLTNLTYVLIVLTLVLSALTALLVFRPLM